LSCREPEDIIGRTFRRDAWDLALNANSIAISDNPPVNLDSIFASQPHVIANLAGSIYGVATFTLALSE